MTDSQKPYTDELTTPDHIGDIPLSNEKTGQSSETNETRSQPIINSHPIPALKFSEEVHQYLREYIRNADQKAIFFFTISSGFLVFLNSEKVSKHWLKVPSMWTMIDFIAFLSMTTLTIAAIFFLWVIIPRLNGSKKGLVFFNSIAEYTIGNEYIVDVLRSSEVSLTHEKLKHCYELAKICNTKYKRLVSGLYVGMVAFASSLIYLLIT
jgi:hypothetical protein